MRHMDETGTREGGCLVHPKHDGPEPTHDKVTRFTPPTLREDPGSSRPLLLGGALHRDLPRAATAVLTIPHGGRGCLCPLLVELDHLHTRALQAISSTDFLVAAGDKLVMVTADARQASKEAPSGPTMDIGPLSASDCYTHPCSGGGIADMAYYRGAGDSLVATIDESGGVMLSRVPAAGGGWSPCRLGGSPGEGDGENGWGGVAFDTSGGSLVVARGYQRAVVVLDVSTGGVVRKFGAAHTPAHCCFVPSVGGSRDDMLAVAEGGVIALWDVRASGGKGPVQRLSPSQGTVHRLAAQGGLLGCTGSDRSIHAWDSKKWTIRGRAMNVVRSEAQWLAFSRKDPSIYYIAGLDPQLVCGQLELTGGGGSVVPMHTSTGGHQGTHVVPGGSLRRVFDFSAMGKWAATDMMRDSDTFAGLCDQQNLYCLPDFNPLEAAGGGWGGLGVEVDPEAKRQRTE